MNYALLWALIGWGLASWVIILLTLPDPPPPDLWGRFFKVSLVGIVGGVIGGMVARSLLASGSELGRSDPMPGLVVSTLLGAAAGAIIFVGGFQAATAGGRARR